MTFVVTSANRNLSRANTMRNTQLTRSHDTAGVYGSIARVTVWVTYIHLRIRRVPGWAKLNGANAVSFVVVKHVLENFDNFWQVK